MTVKEFLVARGMSILALSKATGIAYTTLQPHVRHGKGLSKRTAERLQKWSSGAMNAAQILGLTAPPPPAP